ANVVGQTVEVTLNSKTYTATVQQNGDWSVNVAPSDLAALTDGKGYVVNATVTDQAGNSAAASVNAYVDETAALRINPTGSTGFINATNLQSGLLISGSVADSLAASMIGQQVTLTLNSKTYSTTVSAAGTWSIDLTPADIAALTDGQSYSLSASVT